MFGSEKKARKSSVSTFCDNDSSQTFSALKQLSKSYRIYRPLSLPALPELRMLQVNGLHWRVLWVWTTRHFRLLASIVPTTAASYHWWSAVWTTDHQRLSHLSKYRASVHLWVVHRTLQTDRPAESYIKSARWER